jgi:hypothetical protein
MSAFHQHGTLRTVCQRPLTPSSGHSADRYHGEVETLGLFSTVVALTCCVALIVLLWLVRAYALFAYLVALPLLQLTICRSLSVPKSTIAAAVGASVIAMPIALLGRRSRLRAERNKP